MNSSALVDLLLKAGQGLLSNGQASTHSRQRQPDMAAGLGKMLGNAGGAALASSVLGMLLGSKGGRKLGGKALTYGGLAALGVLAYKAYNQWQAGQAEVPPAQDPAQLSAPQAETRARALLKALVGAALADGHVDAHERSLLDEQLQQLAGADAELSRWVQAELDKPLDPSAVAQAAPSPEVGAEMYVASLVMVGDEVSFMERAYLDELARQLKLADDLKASLEEQVRAELS